MNATVDTVQLPAGAEGIDFAWWRPTAQAVRWWAFVVRYICRLPNGKAVGRAEIDRYHSAGVAVLLVWEQAADDWTHGTARGLEQGRFAAAFARTLGYPQGMPILFAFDTNAVPGDARAYAYGTAAASVVTDAGYLFGVYGDLDVIRVLADHSRLNWLAGATSWSDPTAPYQPETMPGYDLVDVRQMISGSTVNYDRNIVLHPIPGWLPHPALVPVDELEPPTVPTTTPNLPALLEDDMQILVKSPNNGSCVLTVFVKPDNSVGYRMSGIATGDMEAICEVDAGMRVVHWPDDVYLTRAAGQPG